MNPDKVDSSCALPYEYDRFQKDGTFDGITTFFVDDDLDAAQVKERQFAYQFMHDSLLRIKFVDAKGGKIFYQMFDTTLQEHIQILAQEGARPLMSVQPETDDGVVEIHFVPRVFRKIFKSFLSFLEHSHSKSRFTTGFDMENIVMKDGDVKFYRVHFRYIGNPDKKKAAKIEDYKRLHAIISAILAGEDASIPRDMQHFLGFLVDKNKNKANAAKHVALLGYRESLQIAVDLNDLHIKGKEKAKLGWKKNVEDSRIQMLIDCLNFQEPDGKNPFGEKFVDTNAYNATSQLFRFLRNVCAHLKPQKANPIYDVDNKTIAASVMDIFGDTIAEFQEDYLYK